MKCGVASRAAASQASNCTTTTSLASLSYGRLLSLRYSCAFPSFTMRAMSRGYLLLNLGSAMAPLFAEIAKRYPEAMIICAHICGGGDWEWEIKALRNASSIYLDTSGSVADEGVVEMAAEVLGV